MKPLEWVHLVGRDQTLPSRAKSIAAWIACSSTPGPPAHSNLSLRQLQHLTGFAKRDVVVAGLRDLVDAGWLAEQHNTIPSAKGGQRHLRTTHHLVVPTTLLPVDNPPPGDDPDALDVVTSGDHGGHLRYPDVVTSGDHKKVVRGLVGSSAAVARVDPVDNPAGQAQVLAFITGIADTKRLR